MNLAAAPRILSFAVPVLVGAVALVACADDAKPTIGSEALGPTSAVSVSGGPDNRAESGDEVETVADRTERDDGAPAGPRLPARGDQEFTAGTCFQSSIPGVDPIEVPCTSPHRIEVYATPRVDWDDTDGADDEDAADDEDGELAAVERCRSEFRGLTGVDLGLAPGLSASVLMPGAPVGDAGSLTVTCYVVFDNPATEPLAALDPSRFGGRVSIYGLRRGDCLIDLDLTETDVALTPCGQPHDAEVFAAYDLPAGDYPGLELVDSLAATLCFGQGFTDFVGVPFDQSVIDSVKSAPTEETWALGHRRIACVATDGLVRTESLAGSAR